MQYEIYPPYKVANTYTFFESYMLATTPRHFKRHKKLMFDAYVLDGKTKQSQAFQMEDLQSRKEAFRKFNRLLKQDNNGHMPKADTLGTGLVYFDYEQGDPDDDTLFAMASTNLYSNLAATLLDFCNNFKRIALVTPHLLQYTDKDKTKLSVPHAHILYQENFTGELQLYLKNKLPNL